MTGDAWCRILVSLAKVCETLHRTHFHINTIAWGFTLLMHYTFVLVHLEGMQKAMTDSHWGVLCHTLCL